MAEPYESKAEYYESLKSGELVKIRLTPSNDTFTLLKARLCEASAYFRGMFELGLNPGSTLEVIELDDVSPEVMSAIMLYLYHHELAFVPAIAHEANTCKSSEHKAEFCIENLPAVVDIYIAADKYDFLGLRNECLTHIHSTTERSHTVLNDWSAAVWTAYGKALTKLPPTSKLHRLLLSHLCWVAGQDRYLDDIALNHIRKLLPDFVLIELLRVFISGTGVSAEMEFEDNSANLDHWLEEEEA